MIRPAGQPVPPSPYGPWCVSCGEFWTASIRVALCPVCLDVQRLETKQTQTAIGRTRFASVFNRNGDAA